MRINDSAQHVALSDVAVGVDHHVPGREHRAGRRTHCPGVPEAYSIHVCFAAKEEVTQERDQSLETLASIHHERRDLDRMAGKGKALSHDHEERVPGVTDHGVSIVL